MLEKLILENQILIMTTLMKGLSDHNEIESI